MAKDGPSTAQLEIIPDAETALEKAEHGRHDADPGHDLQAVSYTHLTLPTNREV